MDPTNPYRITRKETSTVSVITAIIVGTLLTILHMTGTPEFIRLIIQFLLAFLSAIGLSLTICAILIQVNERKPKH